MAINFPDNPSLNDIFTVDSRIWQWDGVAWRMVSASLGPTGPAGPTGPDGRFFVSSTAPATPSEGDVWFNSNTGKFFVYYDSFWVETSSNQAGPQGPIGPTGPAGQSAYDIAVDNGFIGTEQEWLASIDPVPVVAALVDSAPTTLDTLNELAAALGDDPNFATTIVTQLGTLESEVDTKTSTGKAIAMAIVFGG